MRVVVTLALVCATSACFGQVITTVAGTDFVFPRTPLPALNAPLSTTFGAQAIDAAGDLVLFDFYNNRIFQISSAGVVSVVAGNGLQGSGLPLYSGDGGPAVAAALSAPAGVAMDSAGNIYIGDSMNNVIRKVSPTGTISTFAGNGRRGYSGDGGPAIAAALSDPQDLMVDAAGNLYIADSFNDVVRRVSVTGTITTVAGNGTSGFSGDGGQAAAAQLNFRFQSCGLAVDRSGNLYIADCLNSRIRKVTPDGIIRTVAGNGSTSYSGEGGQATATGLCGPFDVVVDGSGNLFIADQCPSGDDRVLKVSSTGIITTVAGNGTAGHNGDGGKATAAAINPYRLLVDPLGNLYISEFGGYLRKVTPNGQITTIAGNGQFGNGGDSGPATRANLHAPTAVAVGNDGSLIIVDNQNFRVRRVSSGGVISTIAGNGTQGEAGDGGPAIAAELLGPQGVAVDAAGNVYIADGVAVRKVSPSGTISTLAGSLGDATAVALDGAGNVYVTESQKNRVSKISPTGAITPVGPSSGLNFPAGVVVGADGTIFISDTGNSRVAAVSPAGVTTVFAGTGKAGYSGDGGPAKAAQLDEPIGLSLDGAGNLYIADALNSVIRKVSPSGTITTVAGNGTSGFSGDGGVATAAQLNSSEGVAVDASGNVFIADTTNNRVREVLTSPPSISSAPSTFTFSGFSGGAPGPAQLLTISSSIPYVPFGLSVSTKDGNTWLSADASAGVATRNIQITADPSLLVPGSYSGTVTIQTAVASPGTISIPVSFTVGPGVPPQLALDQSSLTFTFPAGAKARSQPVRVQNTGDGLLDFLTKVSPNDPWLSVSPLAGSSKPSKPITVEVTADPSGLSAGTYVGSVTITTRRRGRLEFKGGPKVQAFTVPVTMTISTNPSALLLSQAGIAFTAIAGGGVVPPQSFGVVNLGAGPLNPTASPTTITGGNWLAAATSTASTGSPSVTVAVNPAGLAAGHYYGLVNVKSAGAANSPQVATAMLQVLPAGTDLGAVLTPNELTFNATLGAESPGSQNVLVYDLTATPKAFTASSSQAFVIFDPVTTVVTPDQPTQLVIQPFTSQLAAGTYHGSITLQFDDLRVRTIGITIVVAAQNASAVGASAARKHDVGAACQATQLLPAIMSLGSGFSVPAGWPVVVQTQVQDDCGNALQAGSVVAEFSNGDPPLPLLSTTGGEWDGTWLAQHTAAGVTVTVRATSSDQQLTGSKQVLGGFDANQQPPMVASSGITDAASNISFRPLTPGGVITINGSLLSDQTATATAPYGLSLGDTSVVIAGNQMPVAATGPNQVSAIIPYGTAVNTQQQIILLRADTISLPVQVNLAAASPAIYTTNGSSQGMIVDKNGKVIAPGNAAKAGDPITVYCTGLGELQQSIPAGSAGPASSATTAPVSLSIGGETANITFSGLAPQLVGIYFVQATVPSGIASGDQIPVTLTSLTSPPAVSPTVTMAITN